MNSTARNKDETISNYAMLLFNYYACNLVDQKEQLPLAYNVFSDYPAYTASQHRECDHNC